MDRRSHWQQVYRTKDSTQVSWFQGQADVSCRLIASVAADRRSRIVDVGGGASTLVDGLLAAGYLDVTVMDLSIDALAIAQKRLGGSQADRVAWHEADVLTAPLPFRWFDVWHDRAVFHFLTCGAERERYVAQVRHAVRPGGHVLVAAFAEDGPTRCSGLDVARYTPQALHAEFGAGFRLCDTVRELHQTPTGALQAFNYCVCRYEPDADVTAAA
jgi:SAM-dependent methyltransferase